MQAESTFVIRMTGMMAALLACVTFSGLATAAPVAFVQAAQSTSDLSSVIRITRAGQQIAVKGRYFDLEAGDEITLRRVKAQAVVRYLGNNATHWVRRKAGSTKAAGPDYRVEAPRVASLPQAVFNWLVSQFVGQPAGRDTHEITASSRSRFPGGGCAGSDGPVALRGIDALPARLAAGTRSIAVQWAGGLAPYTVAISGDGKGEQAAAPATGRCATLLPSRAFTPGPLIVELRDSNKPEPVQIALEVVDLRPAMPDALGNAPLDEVSRQLYYASWLRSIEGGVWSLEAQQVVMALDCHDPAVLEWLDNAGLDPVCEASGINRTTNAPGG